MLETILTHLVAGLSGWGILEGSKYVMDTVRRRKPLCVLYPFSKSRKVWIVLSEVPANKKGEFFSKTSPIDGVYSFDDVSDYLRCIGLSRQEYDTRFGSDLAIAMYGDDLILIGGYENNKVSGAMDSSFRSRRRFYLENNTIYEQGNSKRSWGIDLDDNKTKVVRDHCLITKMPNPFGSSQQSWVVAFEGVREYGTWGAVRYWNQKLIKRLRNEGVRIKPDDTIEAVVAIKVNYFAEGVDTAFEGLETLYLNGHLVRRLVK